MTRSARRLWAVVPAGGTGRRFGGHRPKQYADLLGRPVICWSLQPFIEREDIESVVVPVSASDDLWESCRPASPKLVRVDGGETRCASVLAGLNELMDSAEATDWVLVHDAVRPCLQPDDLQHLIDEVVTHGDGGLLAVAVTDTLKRDRDGVVDATVSRDRLWRALTPQMFPLGALREALQSAPTGCDEITDESSAMERSGHRPRLIAGRGDNIKITCPEDLPLAAAILEARSEAR